MNATTDKRDMVRAYYPAIDRDIRAARNDAVRAARDGASYLQRARHVLDDFRRGWLGMCSEGSAHALAGEYVRLAFSYLDRATADRREMKRLIHFRRTACPEMS